MSAEAEEEAVVLKRGNLEDNEMDITPMIDITFLLLIFFVVTSKVDDDTSVVLPPAKHGAVISKKEAVCLSVIDVAGELPKVYKGDKAEEKERILATSAIEQDEAIAEYVEDEIAKAPEKLNVLIQADKNLKSRDVQRIARAACRTENVKLFYKVQEE